MGVPQWRSRSFTTAAVLGLVAALAVACADPEPDAGGPAGGQPGQGDGDAAPTIEIVAPADGDTVTVPFEVTVDASVELGPIDEGLNHFHVWFGDTQDQPMVVESDSVRIEDAPSGEQTMWVSLQEADHTPIGDPVSISITIQGGSEQAPPPPADY